MPNFRYAQSYVTRGSGKNVVATAAYQAAEKLEHKNEALANSAYQAGEKHGRQFNFANKAGGVLHKEIMAPENAPEWVYGREELWNRVDKAEKKSNARLARKLVISLPNELTLQQNVTMLRGFLQDRFVSQGMVADFAVHAPDHDGDVRHVHAHVLLTRRELTPEGFGKLFREAEQGRALALDRKALEKAINHALDRVGIKERVSAESVYARGIVREPEPVLGDKATEEHRRGKHSRAGTLDERTQRRMDWVAQVRMRNRLRISHDLRGEPHPLWLMRYYWEGRDRWIEKQTQRIERVRGKGNIYFASKLERDLDKAREHARRVDHAYYNQPDIRRQAFTEAREQVTKPTGPAPQPAGRSKGRTSGSSFRAASGPVTSPGSPDAPARVHRAGFGSGEASGRAPPARDPNLDDRGNRRDTGDSFIVSAVVDQFTADMRGTFPHAVREQKQAKDFYEHPRTSQTREEEKQRHPGEAEGLTQPSSGRKSRDEQERER